MSNAPDVKAQFAVIFERLNYFTMLWVHTNVLFYVQRIFTLAIVINALSIIIFTFYPLNLAVNNFYLNSKAKANHLKGGVLIFQSL